VDEGGPPWRVKKHALYLFDFASEKRGISFCQNAAVGGASMEVFNYLYLIPPLSNQCSANWSCSRQEHTHDHIIAALDLLFIGF
jgi:hypothetical protein